jgi:hypothetical protein
MRLQCSILLFFFAYAGYRVGMELLIERGDRRAIFIPSNAACTLLFRLCVASNALAVAADDGGFVPLMLVAG